MRSLPILVVLVLVLAVACGGSSKQEAAKPAPEPAVTTATTEGVEGGVEGGIAEGPDADELSKEDCEAVLDHVSQLFIDAGKQEMADEMKNARDEAITQCMATGTRAEYDCFIAAKVMDDLLKCGG